MQVLLLLDDVLAAEVSQLDCVGLRRAVPPPPQVQIESLNPTEPENQQTW